MVTYAPTRMDQFGSSQGWTGNLADRAFSHFGPVHVLLEYIYIYIYIYYIYSSKCWWAAWTKKMPWPIFLSQSSPGSSTFSVTHTQINIILWITDRVGDKNIKQA